MAIVNTAEPITWARCSGFIDEIIRTYPFCRSEVLTQTAFGRNLRTLVIGNGPRKVIYAGTFHANEWITALVLLKFVEDFAAAIQSGGEIFGVNARQLRQQVTIYTLPMVNPDGVDLVVGAIEPGDIGYDNALQLSENYPSIPFPEGWKANLRGVDLNLQYPAGWLRAREIKFSQGYTRPGPRDYVGRAPLDQLESRSLAGYTEYIDPALILAYHTQGKDIYWQFLDYFVPGARELGEKLAQVSGYTLAEPPSESGFAGYKDWFIKVFHRPAYTIEAGSGANPLPLSQFDEIYKDNLGILVTAAQGLQD